MPYVDRDSNNAIAAIYAAQQRAGQEFLADNDAEVVAFKQAPIDAANTAKAADDAIRTAASSADDILTKLKTLSPADWQSYLTTNVTTVATARTVLYRMGLVLMLLARRV